MWFKYCCFYLSVICTSIIILPWFLNCSEDDIIHQQIWILFFQIQVFSKIIFQSGVNHFMMFNSDILFLNENFQMYLLSLYRFIMAFTGAQMIIVPLKTLHSFALGILTCFFMSTKIPWTALFHYLIISFCMITFLRTFSRMMVALNTSSISNMLNLPQ